MNTDAVARTKGRIDSVWRSPLLHPLNDAEVWDGLLSRINPMWSTRDYPARVMDIVAETDNTKSFLLQAVARWPGHRAGQHLVLETELNGRRLHRSFSISSAPSGDGRLRITVKHAPGARVSSWLHTQVRVGDVLRLSAPSGDFCAPDEDIPLLMLSAGSGITPLLAILLDRQQRGYRAPIVFMHSCRSPADFIFAAQLRALAQHWPSLELRVHYSAEHGRLDARQLAESLPFGDEICALVCGPAALTEVVEALYRERGLSANLRSESYSGRVLPRGAGTGTAHTVTCTITKQVFTASDGQSLLGAAEAAGLQPASGCRIGICKTCQCRKRSGTVQNLRTGEISSEADELIQLCISQPRSALELQL